MSRDRGSCHQNLLTLSWRGDMSETCHRHSPHSSHQWVKAIHKRWHEFRTMWQVHTHKTWMDLHDQRQVVIRVFDEEFSPWWMLVKRTTLQCTIKEKTPHFVWKHVKHSIITLAVTYFEKIKLPDTIISPGEFIAWRAILQSIYKWRLDLMEMEN